MKLEQIRKRTAYPESIKPTCKSALRAWLLERANDYPFALTLTLKTSIKVNTEKGAFHKKLTREDCEKAVERFEWKLNQVVFGTRSTKAYGRTLNFIPVLEGERSSKNLHLHLAIGGFPKFVRLNEVTVLIDKAKSYVDILNSESAITIADTGWCDYISKEAGRWDTDNVLWQHVK
jgi:hypothetical protein